MAERDGWSAKGAPPDAVFDEFKSAMQDEEDKELGLVDNFEECAVMQHCATPSTSSMSTEGPAVMQHCTTPSTSSMAKEGAAVGQHHTAPTSLYMAKEGAVVEASHYSVVTVYGNL